MRDAKERIEKTYDLFSQHGKAIYTMILFHVYDTSLADDLYQDLFLSIVERPLPEDLRYPLSYLWRVVANDARDLIRKQQYDNHKLEKYLSKVNCSADPDSMSPFDVLADIEKKRRLIEMLYEKLYPHEAKIVMERLVTGANIKEIAKTHNIKERSVSRYLSTALKKLKKLAQVDPSMLDELKR